MEVRPAMMQRKAPWLSLALLLPLLPSDLPAQAQPQQDELLYLEKVNKDFLDRVKRCEENKDWKGFFEYYVFALKRHSQSVIQVGPDRWTSVNEYFLGRIAQLPREALNVYRFENDGKARSAFERARESGSRRDLERAVEEYFFADGADEMLDALAVEAFDEGRVEEARAWWNRLLRLYPDSRLDRGVTAARIAHACLASENTGALEDLRRWLAKNKVEGTVSVGGRKVPVPEYVAQLTIPVRPLAARPPKMPYLPEPEDRLRRPSLGVRNDIRRWVYDFNEDRGEPAAQAEPPGGQPPIILGRPRRPQRENFQAPPPYPEFPLVPAYGRVRGKDYVIFTDGTRVLAVDPGRVKGRSTTAGVYWKYPSDKAIPRPQSNPNVAYGRPYVGVTIEGEHAFVTMYSSPEARQRDPVQANGADGFEGVTSVKCLHIPTGKLVWDTDLPPLLDEFKTACKDYFDRNFSYSAPPLVKGDRLYLGICTSPMGEQESRVVCLDRKTGRPLWTTFLSSVTGTQLAFMGMAYQPAYLPMLAEQGGTLYVQTNLGIVAALNPASGLVQWMSQYRRSGRRTPANTNMPETAFRRPANPPVLWNGVLYVLAQDRADLMAFDAATGDEIKLPPGNEMHLELDWKSVLHLLGPVNDALICTGSMKTFEVTLRDETGPCYKANYLIASACRNAGRGTVTDDFIYLPVMDDAEGNPAGGLGVYDVRTWRVVERPAWKESNDGGNLLVAGNYLVVATNKISVYTDVDTLRNQYVRRLSQSPPNAELLLEYGETMRENDRLEDAGEAYLSFIRAVEGDPRQAEKAREVRRDLHSIFLRRGDEAVKTAQSAVARKAEAVRRLQDAANQRETADRKNDENGRILAAALARAAEADQRQAETLAKTESEKALDCFRYAKEFAWDRDSEAEAVQRLAGVYEGLGMWGEAVQQYQDLIQKGRNLFHRESESVTKLWDHAARRIDDIVGKSPEAYAEVEKQAAEALKKVKEGSVEGLRDVMDRFPNSKAAREAFGKMRDSLLKQGQLDKLRALYGDFQDRFKLKLNFDAYKELLELLEKLGDRERLRFELLHFGERFGDSKVGPEGREESVRDYVTRRLAELDKLPRAAPGLQGPLRLLAELDGVRPSVDPQGVSLGHQPLCPLGVEPGAFGADRELFRRGSSIELWDLKEKRRLWTCLHPGAWLGALYAEAPQGVSVIEVKPGSPAATAGIVKGDLLTAIDGRPLRAAWMADVLSGLAPGAAVELTVRSGAAERKVKATLSAMPAELRPAILGASFTREGALAVAWEDCLASVDLAAGGIRWTFRVSRDRFLFSAFHATEGRVFLYESPKNDRCADPMRLPGPLVPAPGKPPESHHLLFCLSDFTGDVLWARKFDVDAANAFADTKIQFLSRYFSDHVTFLHSIVRGGGTEWSVWQIPVQAGAKSETGALKEPQRHSLSGQVLAWALDPESQVFYYVSDLPDRRERTLINLGLDPARPPAKRMEIKLDQPRFMPYQMSYNICSLAANRDYVALVISPMQQNFDSRIWTWKTSDLKERSLTLPAGRSLPVGRSAGLGVGPEDLLYVYNVPRDRSPAQAGGRAWITAFRMGAEADADLIAWDSKAPFMNDTTNAAMVHGAGNFEILTAPNCTAPGEVSANPAVLVYDRKAEGYVRMDRSDVANPADPNGEVKPSAAAWRGRLFVLTPKSLEIYGD